MDAVRKQIAAYQDTLMNAPTKLLELALAQRSADIPQIHARNLHVHRGQWFVGTGDECVARLDVRRAKVFQSSKIFDGVKEAPPTRQGPPLIDIQLGQPISDRDV